nr:MAG TPA: MarR family [Caudoviricetes sp.]
MSYKFTPAAVEQLIEMWNQNFTAKDIALAMDRPFHNIRNKIKALQKAGKIAPRSNSNNIDTTFIEITAGAYGLPVDTVAYFTTLFTGGKERIIASTQQCCEAYVAQKGYCYYLSPQVKLTMDDSPSGIVPMQGHENNLILTCKAIANTRKTMSHASFINLCKAIAKNFEQ